MVSLSQHGNDIGNLVTLLDHVSVVFIQLYVTAVAGLDTCVLKSFY